MNRVKRFFNIRKKVDGDQYKPYVASIYKLCLQTNKLNYYNQIRNRIIWEIEKDNNLLKFVKLDPDNADDIGLDGAGIKMFFEILIGYFPEDEIKKLLLFLTELNRQTKSNFELYSTKNLTAAQIEEIMKVAGI